MPPAKRSRRDDAPASSTAADLHLLPGLEAAHAAARLAYWSDTYRAEVPSPTVLRGVLSAEEVAACCALASASGRRSEPTTAWRTPPPVCPALAECVSSRAPWQHPSALGDGPATLVSPQRLL